MPMTEMKIKLAKSLHNMIRNSLSWITRYETDWPKAEVTKAWVPALSLLLKRCM